MSLLPATDRSETLKLLSAKQLEELEFEWKFWGRPKQFAPDGDWAGWIILAGRGFGKTRMGAEWVRSRACGVSPLAPGVSSRLALIAETAADGRDVMVEGESGLLAVHSKAFRPIYEPSKRRLTWPNGATATIFNATEPDQLRGPQFDAAWSDELAKWRYAQETWDMLQFGLRLGNQPRQIVTTTPRPIPIVRAILKSTEWVVTRGSTFENAANLAPSFLKGVKDRYEGTRLGRQELEAEILDDAPNALWQRENLDRHRVKEPPKLKRIVVAVDPAAKENAQAEDGAATGVMVAGLSEDCKRGYVIEDGTIRGSPNAWARRVIALFDRYDADCVVVETNQGGDMVKAVLHSVRQGLPIREVTATRGKWIRAEPVAALYEQGRISHVGSLPELEDEMVLFEPNGMVGGVSPDRVDSLVWALTELFPQLIKGETKPTVAPRAHVPLPTRGGWMAG
jgi:phage terminase large subunit-like protein